MEKLDGAGEVGRLAGGTTSHSGNSAFPCSQDHVQDTKEARESVGDTLGCTMASKEHRALLRVLDDRGIAIDPDDIAHAFADQSTQDDLASWVRQYLSPPNLLSKEELGL